MKDEAGLTEEEKDEPITTHKEVNPSLFSPHYKIMGGIYSY